MNKHHLIQSIYNGIWHIHPEIAIAAFMAFSEDHNSVDDRFKQFSRDFANSRVGREITEGFITAINEQQPFCIAQGDLITMGRYTSLDAAKKGSIAVIPNIGVMTKYDQYCGPAGTRTKQEQLKQAYDNENIEGVIFLVDTPGGSADGNEAFSEVINSRNKPVVKWITGMSCSAGQFAFSGCDEIIAESAITMVGSIGTMLSFQDIRGYFERKGVKFHEIYAAASGDKNKSFSEALKGNYDMIRSEVLNPFNDSFLNTMRTNRKGKIGDDVLSGKVFMAGDNLGHGLVDYIGNFDFAVQRVRALSPKYKSNSKSNNTMFNSKKFPGIAALSGVAPENITEEMVTKANEDLVTNNISGIKVVSATSQTSQEDAIKDAVTSAEAKKDKEISTLNASISTKDEEIKNLNAKVEELSALPPKNATHNPVGSGKDTHPDEKQKTEADQAIEELNAYANTVLGLS